MDFLVGESLREEVADGRLAQATRLPFTPIPEPPNGVRFRAVRVVYKRRLATKPLTPEPSLSRNSPSLKL